MAKKVFLIFLVLFLILALAFAVHKISSEEADPLAENGTLAENNNQGTGSVETGGTEEPVKDPENFSGKMQKLIDGEGAAVKGAVLNASTSQVLYYQRRNFLLTDFGGKSKNSVGSYPFVSVEDIQWNQTRNKALIKDNGRYFIYDLNSNQSKELAEKIDSAVWFKYVLEDEIIYKLYDAETNTRKLAIANHEGEQEEILIEDLQFRDVELNAPTNGSKVCYYRKPDANFEAGLNCLNLKTKEEETLHQGPFAPSYKWANNGNRILVSYTNEQLGSKMVLGVMNGKGGEFRSLNFPTATDKCVWSKDNRRIFCAMMMFEEKNINLPNDWSSGKFYSTDTFWEVDVETGKKRRILDSSETLVVDAEKLFLDYNENNLFFTDRRTKSVYSISLR